MAHGGGGGNSDNSVETGGECQCCDPFASLQSHRHGRLGGAAHCSSGADCGRAAHRPPSDQPLRSAVPPVGHRARSMRLRRRMDIAGERGALPVAVAAAAQRPAVQHRCSLQRSPSAARCPIRPSVEPSVRTPPSASLSVRRRRDRIDGRRRSDRFSHCLLLFFFVSVSAHQFQTDRREKKTRRSIRDRRRQRSGVSRPLRCPPVGWVGARGGAAWAVTRVDADDRRDSGSHRNRRGCWFGSAHLRRSSPTGRREKGRAEGSSRDTELESSCGRTGCSAAATSADPLKGSSLCLSVSALVRRPLRFDSLSATRPAAHSASRTSTSAPIRY